MSGIRSRRIEALTNGYLYYEEISTAKYTIQCKLEYMKGSR